MDLLDVGPKEGRENDQRAGAPLLCGKAERVRIFQAGEEKAAETPAAFRYLKERKIGTDLLTGPFATGQGIMVLN